MRERTREAPFKGDDGLMGGSPGTPRRREDAKRDVAVAGRDVAVAVRGSRVAVAVARWLRHTKWPANTAHLKDQATRAADSIVLNIAEGLSRGGRPGNNHLRIAKGSAGEALAALDVADFQGCAERRPQLRRIGAMVTKLRGR